MRIVLDTNVLVAGLLNAHGEPGRIVDLVLAGTLEVAFDDRILGEYREVLTRPRFEFDRDDVEHVLADLVAGGVALTAPPLEAVHLPDPDDAPFLEVARAADAQVLVTRNARHFPVEARPVGLVVENPAAFLRRWQRRSAGR